MTQLLVIRERLLRFYQSHTRVINPLYQFLISLVTFFSINQLVGYNPTLKPWYVTLVLSIISAVLPTPVLLLLAAVYTVLHVYYVSFVLAMVLMVVFLIVYLIYIRFLPEHGFVILAVPVLYALHVPYVVPIVLGLIAAPVAVIPMSCGVLCYYMLQSMTTVIGTATEDSVVLYSQAVQMIFSNREMYLMIGVFAIVMVFVNVIRNYEFNYAFELSIVVGAILNILLILGISYPFDIRIHVGYLLIQTLLSAILAWIFQFFALVLNYTAAEYLQFEDDEYYYYVKAVPKINIAVGEKRVKRFNAHLLGGSRFGVRQEKRSEGGSPGEEASFSHAESSNGESNQ